MKEIKIIRVTLIEFNGYQLITQTITNEILTIDCNANQIKELDQINFLLRKGTPLNLLNLIFSEKGNYAEAFVFEPDYLIDISSLSECFKPYGCHPLNYSLSRLQNRETTVPILLGNTANFFMDELLHEKIRGSEDYISLLKKLFQTFPFELSTCKDLKDTRKENTFFQSCQKHYLNLRKVIDELFPKAQIDKEKIILEPSFISNSLGLQGRMDILLSDFSALIELKSGKALEDFRTGGEFIKSAENHYTQMMLYLSILEFNMDWNPEQISSYLLYSKYPILSKEKQSRKQLYKALTLRNKIIAYEYFIQASNKIEITGGIIEKINSTDLNTEHLQGNFFENYLAPGIDYFYQSYSRLNETEKAYFLRIYTFITKELWLSKAGEKEYEGIKKASVLWNASFEDKIIAGEVLFDLTILENKAGNKEHSITLEIPSYKDIYLPNFRQGDAIVLYKRNNKNDSVNNHQVFKGTIEKLESNKIKIRLRYRQKNTSVWDSDSFYAIEHDYMDTTYTSMFRALATFSNANQERKDLILGKRIPLDDSECFLLVGPPGTGKTSVYLKSMVEKQLTNSKGNILLLSYTNKAVDEICKALSDICNDINYIRIGNSLSCDNKYQKYLLENQLKECTKRKEVDSVINNCRIFTGTVASVWNKPELLQLKQFELCIIDEASQLLEPHLLGILCSKTESEQNAIKKMVLIGDHKQLPAIVLQTKEESEVQEEILRSIGIHNLSNSLFERLFRKYSKENHHHLIGLLSQQGRMHPDISAFPSKYFYNELLTCVGLPHQLEIWTEDQRVKFIQIYPSTKETASKSNINEAKEVAKICLDIYQKSQLEGKIFSAQDIGIIAPFRNQLALIKKQLEEIGIKEFQQIMVETVERFQGSQKEIIIYSFSIKTESQLEALPCWTEENGQLIDRKLNVALTRAKKQLFIIGNSHLLIKNPIYKALIEHIHSQTIC